MKFFTKKLFLQEMHPSILKISLWVLTGLLITSLLFVACKSSGKKSKKEPTEDATPVPSIAAPSAVHLTAPAMAASFQRTATVTVEGVEAGDTVSLYIDDRCLAGNMVASGEVDAEATSIAFTVDLNAAPATYHFYAKRTNAEGTSACSAMHATYQAISCPSEMYAPVLGNPVLGTSDFCVMRTEAKRDANDQAVTQYADLPWNNISAEHAKAYCKHLSTERVTYDLVSNRQWMTMAYDIESTAANWSGGAAGVGLLNRGHSDANPNSQLSIEDPTDPWDQTGNKASLRTAVGGEVACHEVLVV